MPRWRAVLLPGVLAAACGADSGHVLKLQEFRQRDFMHVALNEELQFFFSEPLDRSSITSDSVRLFDESGREVSGERLVRGNALTFLPDLPRASTLTDGGLQPRTSYRVALGGFPRPDGIRGTTGALLSSSLLLSFRTAEIGGPKPLFLNPVLGPHVLLPRGRRSTPVELQDGRLILELDEALDPASVPACRFELFQLPEGSLERVSVPVAARLIENRREHAELLVEPTEPARQGRLASGTYYLEMPGRELRTLGNRTVEPGWALSRPILELRVPESRFDLDLARLRDPSAAHGLAGTLLWDEAAGLVLRYPAAAGMGTNGSLELRAPPGASDLHAARLLVPDDATVDLSEQVGPVVLRSQTEILIAGRLVRRGRAAPHSELSLGSALDQAQRLEASERGSLSAWIEQVLAPDSPWALEPWTILIAGGDLRVEDHGWLEVDGPLILVAGGWIRVAGSVRAGGHLWKTPEGGGVSARSVRELPFLLDPPERNLLRLPFAAAMTTRVFPWSGARPISRVHFVGQEGLGRFDLQLQSAPAAKPPVPRPGVVRALVSCEVPVGHGEPWTLPRLRTVRLETAPEPNVTR